MDCLHPHCPMAPAVGHPATWADAIAILRQCRVLRRPQDAVDLMAMTGAFGPLNAPAAVPIPTIPSADLWKRLRAACPCLVTQVDNKPSADSIVHLCEITLGARVTGANVVQAFGVQHPANFLYPPVQDYTNAGQVSQAFCRAVLIEAGLPHLKPGPDKWPVWAAPGFIDLNMGNTAGLSSFGDFLIPAAPTNLLISCKTWAARERLLNSGIRVDTVGFGFFQDAREFWTEMRMNTLRRFGFTVIYMPDATHGAIMARLAADGRTAQAINVNARPLYRPISTFGAEMLAVSGKLSLNL